VIWQTSPIPCLSQASHGHYSGRKFVPSKKNPLLAKILAMSLSISAPSSTSTASNISGLETETSPPQVPEDPSPQKDPRLVLAASNRSCNPEEIQPVVPKRDTTQTNRRRKTPASKEISHSDSDDPLSLSRAPKRKRRTARSKSGHAPDVAASLPPPPEKSTTNPASSSQAATGRASQVQGEKTTKATRKGSRQPTRSNKQQFLESSTEGEIRLVCSDRHLRMLTRRLQQLPHQSKASSRNTNRGHALQVSIRILYPIWNQEPNLTGTYQYSVLPVMEGEPSLARMRTFLRFLMGRMLTTPLYGPNIVVIMMSCARKYTNPSRRPEKMLRLRVALQQNTQRVHNCSLTLPKRL